MTFLRPEREWDQLRCLFGGYLHQDWKLEYASVPEAIADAASDFDNHVLAEFDRLRARDLDEGATDVLLSELGCAIAPEAFGKTPKEFVAWVEDLLRVEMAKLADR